jgi:hypothetical protein
MASVDCQIDIPEVSGLESGEMTVGRHLILNCKGSTDLAFDFSKASFKPEAKNLIHLFAVDPNDQGFKLDLTIYVTGSVKLADFPLTDGITEIVLNTPDLNLKSVIKPPEGGKPPEPFGPVFPIPINIPLSYYMVFAGVILLIAIFSFLKAKRLAYYRKLKSKLVYYNSPTDPEIQFYRSIRSAEKLNYPVVDLEKAFRLYNLRAYKLPLFDLSNEKVIRYFKRNYPEHKNTRLQLQKLLGEFEELSKDQKNANKDEKNELIKKMYRYVDTNKGLPNE